MLLSTNWEVIKKENSSSSALALTELLEGYVDLSFPLKKRTVKSTDVPWFTNYTKKCGQRKLRIYKKEGKSERYFAAKKVYEEALKNA